MVHSNIDEAGSLYLPQERSAIALILPEASKPWLRWWQRSWSGPGVQISCVGTIIFDVQTRQQDNESISTIQCPKFDTKRSWRSEQSRKSEERTSVNEEYYGENVRLVFAQSLNNVYKSMDKRWFWSRMELGCIHFWQLSKLFTSTSRMFVQNWLGQAVESHKTKNRQQLIERILDKWDENSMESQKILSPILDCIVNEGKQTSY